MTPSRVVFDCMVFLQALANPNGPGAACFDVLKSRGVTLCVSGDILDEIADVLCRPELTRKFPRLTPDRVAEFLEFVERAAMFISEVPRRFTLERDPKDEKYLNLAVAAEAAYLVTRDNDLLDLTKPGDAVGEQVRALLPKLRILTIVAFVQGE